MIRWGRRRRRYDVETMTVEQCEARALQLIHRANRLRAWARTLALLALALVVLSLLAGCYFGPAGADSDAGAGSPPVTDPRDGWVRIDGDIAKHCDGRNLIYVYSAYQQSGIAVVPLAQECLP